MKMKYKSIRLLVLPVFAALNLSPFVLMGQPVTFADTTCNIYPGAALGVAVADVNGDGMPDLISANGYANTLTVLTNNGSGVFGSNAMYNVGSNPQWVLAADLLGNGAQDLVSANTGDSTLTVLTNNGGGIFISNATYNVGSGPACVVAADVNGDGYLDLISANGQSDTLTVLTNNGNGAFGLNATLQVGWFPRSLVAVDVNGDGKVDLVCANSGSASLTVLTNNGSGVFGINATLPVDDAPSCVTAADVNGNGRMDLISANSGSSSLTIYTNNGQGVFGYNSTLTVGPVPYSVVAADFNGLGSVDLISLNNGNTSLTVLTNNGSGVFGSNTMFFAPGLYPQCLVTADLNGDKKPDLVFANSQESSLTVLLNTTVFPPPFSITQPLNQVVTNGGTATFTVTAFGPGPFTYQWQLNGTNIPNNIITTVAGEGGTPGSAGYSGDDGPGTNAELNNPAGVVLDCQGNVYIGDALNDRVRKVAAAGIITTFAGGGTHNIGDGGAATNAELNAPGGVAMDAGGNLYIADAFHYRVRKVDTNGIITTVAGNGSGFSGDGGAATNAEMDWPAALAVDGKGNLFIADIYNNRIREVQTNGIIKTVAGGGTGAGTDGLGDGLAATNASLNEPSGVAVDATGRLFIVDCFNNRVRMVGTNGIIMTVAGGGNSSGTDGIGDGGAATNASLETPLGVTVDGAGNLFIIDEYHNCVRKVGTNGIIGKVAGGAPQYRGLGDGGPATNAFLWFYNNYYNSGLALDTLGNLYIADTYDERIREVHFAGLPTLTLNDITAQNAGNYSVIITSSSGSVTSSVATLTELLPPQNFSATSANGSQLYLQLTGTTNYPYILQMATNLAPPINWQPVGTNSTDSTGRWNFTVTNVSVPPSGYFRAAGN